MVTRTLALLAAVLFAAMMAHVMARQHGSPEVPDPHLEPFVSPFERSVCGSGIVEPEDDEVEVAAPIAGVVAEVHVRAGSFVAAGAPLFRLDDRHLRAERMRRAAALGRARAEVERLEQPVRSEALAVKEAAVAAARVDMDRAEETLGRVSALVTEGAAGDEEFREARYRLQRARSQFVLVTKECDLLRAGTWHHDLEIARAALRESEAGVAQIDAEISRLLVCSPVEAEVLQANVQPGEAVGEPGEPAPVVLGKRNHQYIRVDIDEFDLERFNPAGTAMAVPKGDVDSSLELEFVRVEPLLVPKQSLTGISSERVDTRVLQVIYKIPHSSIRLYYGQQVYVCVESQQGGMSANDSLAGGLVHGGG